MRYRDIFLMAAVLVLLSACSTPGGTNTTPVATQAAQTIGGSQGTTQGTEGMTIVVNNNSLPINGAKVVEISVAGGETTVRAEGFEDGQVTIKGGDLSQKIGDGAITIQGSSGGQQGGAAGGSTGGATTGRGQ